jgi:hypothetical protein
LKDREINIIPIKENKSFTPMVLGQEKLLMGFKRVKMMITKIVCQMHIRKLMISH